MNGMSERRKKWLKRGALAALVLLVAAGTFLWVVDRFGGNPRHSDSLAGKVNRISDMAVSAAAAVSIEAHYRYLVIYDWFTGYDKSTRVGWVTDIHADRFKHRFVESGMLYPREYSDYLPKVFDALRSQGITTVISTGDNVNSGDDAYAAELVKIARERDMNVIWVKGNHDSEHSMHALGVNGAMYYTVEFRGTRIIVLDNTTGMEDYSGTITDDEINWIRGELKTDEPVIVAMHIPIFPVSLETTVMSQYTELETMLHNSGNVKAVISGHLHIPWQKEYDGLRFYGEGALTREGMEGEYGVIDLKDFSVKYEYAK